LEFLRIAQSHGFNQMILSMKASNPKVMIQAYRLLVDRMQQESMAYPLHLGVTEAGDGEDGRIKSAIGIGSLLLDGLGDTIRVSLTEDSVYEIPVARAIASKAMSLWNTSSATGLAGENADRSDSIDPFHFTKRETTTLTLGPACPIGVAHPPRVLVRVPLTQVDSTELQRGLNALKTDTPAEGWIVPISSREDLRILSSKASTLPAEQALVLDLGPELRPDAFDPLRGTLRSSLVLTKVFTASDRESLGSFVELIRAEGWTLAVATTAHDLALLSDVIKNSGVAPLLVTWAPPAGSPSTDFNGPGHAIGAYRSLAETLRVQNLSLPLWIRNTTSSAVQTDPSFLSKLIEASFLTGSLLCDGLGDIVSIETETDPIRATKLSYNVLQGAGARISKTEFVACPSCGRTLFDLQTTTQRIREKTGHLKGVKIAIMGCIVNGPGEMADADFGYVGGAPGKINLYVGKTCVQYNIPEAEADSRLIALIREHGRWVEPPPVTP